MNAVNITFHCEQTAKRISRHGSIIFAKPTTKDDAREALKAAGVNLDAVSSGFARKLIQLTEHVGSRHFEFFAVDEVPE